MVLPALPYAQVIAAIDDYMQRFGNGTTNAHWYVGIACDPEARLFQDHRVAREGRWVYARAACDRTARDAESAYHNAGCRGGSSGGDATTCFVYAYLISSTTVE